MNKYFNRLNFTKLKQKIPNFLSILIAQWVKMTKHLQIMS